MKAHSIATLLALLVLIPACGGGSSAGEPEPEPGPLNEPSAATFVFPYASCLTTRDVVTVRGTASDADGIAAVFVGGVRASSSDGFATWSAVVPLTEGDNRVGVTVHDMRGESADDVATLDVQYRPGALVGTVEQIAFDPDRDRILLLDSSLRALLFLDSDTGIAHVLSDTFRDGTLLRRPRGLFVDVWNKTALVTDSGHQTVRVSSDLTTSPDAMVLEVDLATGRRTVALPVSGGWPESVRWPRGAVTGPEVGEVSVLTYGSLVSYPLDESETPSATTTWTAQEPMIDLLPAFPSVRDAAAVVGVKRNGKWWLEVRQRSVLFAIRGFGDDQFQAMSVNPLGGSILLLATGRDGTKFEPRLRRLDPLSLVSTTLASDVPGEERGTGPALPHWSSLAMDTRRDRVLLSNESFDDWYGILAVDPRTGNRSIARGRRTLGSGTQLPHRLRRAPADADGRAAALTFNPATGSVVCIGEEDDNRIHFVAPDPETPRAQAYISSLDALLNGAVCWVPAAGRGLVADYRPGSIHWIEQPRLLNPRRELFSGQGVGAGPDLDFPCGIALDAERDRVLVCDLHRQALFAIDLSTGDRTILSASGTGAGAFLSRPIDVVFDPEANRALVLQRGSQGILVVDPDSGDRVRLSDSFAGTGIRFVRPERMALDRESNRVLVTDSTRRAVISVDLATGRRTVFSSLTVGTGPPFAHPTGITILPNRPIAMVLDSGTRSLIAVDLTTGDRVIVSR